MDTTALAGLDDCPGLDDWTLIILIIINMNIINNIISIILIIKTCRLCCAVGMHRSIELEHRARARA